MWHRLKHVIYTVIVLLLYMCTTAYSNTHITYNENIRDPLVFTASRIKMFEGFAATRYRDSVNPKVWLQGYGRSISGHTPNKISKSTADKWLAKDLLKCKRQLDDHFPWWKDLSKVRQCAMLDLTYNLGIEKLKRFKQFLHNMQYGNYTNAAYCLTGNKHRKTRYARQVGVRAREIYHAITQNEWKHMKK